MAPASRLAFGNADNECMDELNEKKKPFWQDWVSTVCDGDFRISSCKVCYDELHFSSKDRVGTQGILVLIWTTYLIWSQVRLHFYVSTPSFLTLDDFFRNANGTFCSNIFDRYSTHSILSSTSPLSPIPDRNQTKGLSQSQYLHHFLLIRRVRLGGNAIPWMAVLS